MIGAITIGDQLDSKYRVVRQLGCGGFGEVYLAEDELLGRQVAIKLLRDRDPDHQADLVHEMQSLDQLHHPSVVTFYHHFIHEQLLFLFMEYCTGGSLRSRMREQPTQPHTVFEWGKDLTATLYFIHQHGIVHHDIKPDNILFTTEGTLKVGDFGVANRNFGTLLYLAPEMLLGEVDSGDVRVDVYALGITLVELLLNRSPFKGMSEVEVLRAKIRHQFVPANLDRWMQDVLSKATHPTPELRFQSMQEFREAIDSKHVSYVFDRSRVQAHALAAKAERLLARKHVEFAHPAWPTSII
jgi:serine/threonine protein kinase